MVVVRSRSVLVTLVAVATLAALVSAQITFSRDWTGGKRAAPLAVDCGQFARLCRHFLHEMKAAMSAPRPGTKQQREDDKLPDQPLYDEE